MFIVTGHKDTITVKRRLTLEKEGILPAGVLECEASLELGAELKGSEGRAILSKFDSLFNAKIAAKAKKQDERIEKTRQQLEKWVHLGESENKIRSYADTQQEDIIRDWNSFTRVDVKRAAMDALQDALKNTSIAFDDLKLKFSSTDLHDNKMEFLTGVLDIAGRGGMGRVAEAGMTSLVSGLQGLGKPFAAMKATWADNEKLLRQGAEDAATIGKNLAAMGKAARSLESRLGRMQKIAARGNKVAGQGAKGVSAVQAAIARHHQVAKLNDEDKIVTLLHDALSGLSAAGKAAKASRINADTARLGTLLKEINKLLAEAEGLSKSQAAAYGSAAKASHAAAAEMHKSETAITAALNELKLQAKAKS